MDKPGLLELGDLFSQAGADTMNNLIKLFENLGFTFALDYDGQVLIEYPSDLTAEQIAEALGKYASSIARILEYRGLIARSQYVGGPLNGQNHGHSWYHRAHIAKHIARARWAAYLVTKDGRAFYCGEATNEKKALLLARDYGKKKAICQ